MSRQSGVPAGLDRAGTHGPWSETLCILPVLLERDDHAKDSSHSSGRRSLRRIWIGGLEEEEDKGDSVAEQKGRFFRKVTSRKEGKEQISREEVVERKKAERRGVNGQTQGAASPRQGDDEALCKQGRAERKGAGLLDDAWRVGQNETREIEEVAKRGWLSQVSCAHAEHGKARANRKDGRGRKEVRMRSRMEGGGSRGSYREVKSGGWPSEATMPEREPH
jgi:hypothetical protein